MQRTITLTASASYGFGGKQYIAHVTGRDAKFTFAREFVGTKSGKRRESAEYQTDEPGLYVTCDIDRKGNKDETYWVVEKRSDGSLDNATCTRGEAMLLARLLDEGRDFAEAVAEIWPVETPASEAVAVTPDGTATPDDGPTTVAAVAGLLLGYADRADAGEPIPAPALRDLADRLLRLSTPTIPV